MKPYFKGTRKNTLSNGAFGLGLRQFSEGGACLLLLYATDSAQYE